MADEFAAYDDGRLPGFTIDDRPVAVYPLVPTRSFDEPLTYTLPGAFAADVSVGSVVEVPVGKAARVGVVASMNPIVPPGIRLRPVARVVDMPAVPPVLVELASWIADQYGCARTVALGLVSGPKLAAQARATAVPHRRRQLAARRLVEDVGGIELTKRQRELAARVPMNWAPVAQLCEVLGTTRPTLGKLAEAGVLTIDERFLDELDVIEAATPDELAAANQAREDLGSAVTLSDEQLSAVAICVGEAEGTADDPATLLVGVTGSGKTEVYLESIAHVLEAGRDAIVLVPEIALTPQTARRFHARFPDIVEVLHSGMTKAERARAHERIHSGVARVVVGPRSAIFAPVRSLGIVVIDEEHDSSYKQDSEPRYDARRVAYKRAQLEGARIVFGSATPRPESWVGFQRHVLLKTRPGGGRLAPVEVVDIREHEDEFPLTMPVQDAISAALRRGHKAIILHNRRGYATALHCRTCGVTVRCPRCDVSLVIHGRVARRQRLTCHHCGHDEQVREQCDECGSNDIARMGAGTEQIELRIAETFDVPVFRLDADATKTRGAVGDILAEFAAAGPSLLVGTQMVAKGHDFPDVELAVVIDADSALAIPDFRAEERAFSLVSQLAGRAGRSARTAEHARVIVQTRYPEASFIQAAREHDIDGFLGHELTERKAHDWPPYKRIVRVVVSARSEAHRDRWLTAVADGLRRLEAGKVLGPAPLMRINERERGQVLVVTSRTSDVATAVRNFLGTTDQRRKKDDIRVLLDVDPQALI